MSEPARRLLSVTVLATSKTMLRQSATCNRQIKTSSVMRSTPPHRRAGLRCMPCHSSACGSCVLESDIRSLLCSGGVLKPPQQRLLLMLLMMIAVPLLPLTSLHSKLPPRVDPLPAPTPALSWQTLPPCLC